MKTLILSAAAVAAIALTPALAQNAPAPARAVQMQPITRAAMIQKVQQQFARVDANKDGFVTKAEMEAARSALHERAEKRMGDNADAMFDRIDSNKDGSISRAEFDAAHQAFAQHRGHGGMRFHGAAIGAHVFAMADANNDGRVSLQEATAAAAAHFDKADANHDGTLTRDEMRAAHKAMWGRSGRR